MAQKISEIDQPAASILLVELEQANPKRKEAALLRGRIFGGYWGMHRNGGGLNHIVCVESFYFFAPPGQEGLGAVVELIISNVAIH